MSPCTTAFTTREIQIVKALIRTGYIPNVAREIFVSESTVHNDLDSIRDKVQKLTNEPVQTNLQAIYYMAKRGII